MTDSARRMIKMEDLREWLDTAILVLVLGVALAWFVGGNLFRRNWP